jgi:UDP-N-acetylglucosamine--N-acetylmuramyl-(pentapeptide) pyrophosphoryl-undecaprenol N-acetylglucosamine transferase
MRPRTLHLVAARGGHLELLWSLREAFDGADRVWITEPSLRAEHLAAAGERVVLVPPYGRSPRRLVTHLDALRRELGRDRPELVVSAGGGLTVPFCVLARAARARVLMIETMARIAGASMSGRVVSRLAAAVLVQWPEMARSYPGAIVCRPVLLERIGTLASGPEGEGTFVAVGTERQPYDRLLRIVDEAAAAGVLPGPVLVQTGHSSHRGRHVRSEPWLPPGELETAIAAARHVVCHAGSGIVSAALRAGKRPLVLPRRAIHGEMVDDHQLQLTAKLAQLRLIVPLDGTITSDHLAAADDLARCAATEWPGVPLRQALAAAMDPGAAIPSREALSVPG